jgi:hypothetical protein
MSVRLRALTAVGAAGLLSLTGCSTVTHAAGAAASQAAALPADAVAALGLASTQIDRVGSARLVGSSLQPGQTQAEKIDGAISWGSGAELEGQMSGIPEAAELSTTGSVQVEMLSGVMYIKVDAAAAQQFGGRDWLKLDFAALGAASGTAQGASLGSSVNAALTQFSPVQTVRELAGDKGVRSVGKEAVDGVSTTHYTGTVTLAQMAAAEPGLTAAQRQTLVEADTKVGLTGESIDVWLNSRALPVEVREQANTPKGELLIDRHFSDYGTPVSVSPPSTSETYDLAAALEQQKREAKSS